MIGKPRPRPNPHKKAPAKKPAPKPVNTIQAASNKAVGTYNKNLAAWQKAYDKKIAAIKAGKGTAAQKAKAIAAFKAAAAKNKPVKPTSVGDLEAQYGWAHALIVSDPGLQEIFAKAVEGQWAPERFAAAIKTTGWYQQHSESWRNSETLRLSDPSSWAEKIQQRKELFLQKANELGAKLDPAEVNQIADLSARGDWNDSQIKHWVASRIDLTSGGGLFGLAGKAEDELKQLAAANGVSYNPDWYRNAAKSVLADDTNIDEWADQIRELAAQTYVGWADKIRAGQNVDDMAAPYKQAMSRVLEIPENQVSLQDPTLRKAITNTTPDGQPAASPLWQFEKDLRSDSRWRSTKNAQSTAAQSGAEILKQWGLMK